MERYIQCSTIHWERERTYDTYILTIFLYTYSIKNIDVKTYNMFTYNYFCYYIFIFVYWIFVLLIAGGKKIKTKLGKYIIPLIIGVILIKSILLPLTLKTLAVLSGKAVVLSLMSLILAAIVGLKKAAQETSYEINKYRRQDKHDFIDNAQEFEPYQIYEERHKKK